MLDLEEGKDRQGTLFHHLNLAIFVSERGGGHKKKRTACRHADMMRNKYAAPSSVVYVYVCMHRASKKGKRSSSAERKGAAREEEVKISHPSLPIFICRRCSFLLTHTHTDRHSLTCTYIHTQTDNHTGTSASPLASTPPRQWTSSHSLNQVSKKNAGKREGREGTHAHAHAKGTQALTHIHIHNIYHSHEQTKEG